ncbi:MAG: hypothetical protein A2W25_15150 [candidate division Zixibacteria bacterium RBG_16_53_22]|nr:MAG: hypothetical protein A2W25_15150 [candidate division Zixibacteria bacterium RBG_16_53_22]
MANGKAGAPLGNTNGTKTKLFLKTLHKIITDDEYNLPEKKRRLFLAGQQLVNQAARGEEWAIKELANRLDGKAKQQVELSGEDGAPLNFFDPANLRNLSPEETQALKVLLKKAAVNE